MAGHEIAKLVPCFMESELRLSFLPTLGPTLATGSKNSYNLHLEIEEMLILKTVP